jgi:hypothetical protein
MTETDLRGYYDQSYPPSLWAPPPPPPPSTGAIAGAPGSWTPVPSTPPANAAAATAVVASPLTDWTIGQYVQGSTAGAPGEMNWTGTAWVAGRSAVTAEDISGMSIDAVKTLIADHPDLLAEVYAFEQERRKRTSLLSWLQARLDEEAAGATPDAGGST